MAKLINGNGNPAVYAAEDADMLAGIMGNVTTITAVGNEFAATASGANLIEVADGVILTQEGRRIQLDAGLTDAFTIPSGTAGTTNYYIIGYRLYESASGTQECETFVQLMASSTDTIPEETFRGGATEVFVSLYRVEQDGVNLGTISLLLPKVSGLSQMNADLTVTYYNGKLYQRLPDGTRGAEIQMGNAIVNHTDVKLNNFWGATGNNTTPGYYSTKNFRIDSSSDLQYRYGETWRYTPNYLAFTNTNAANSWDGGSPAKSYNNNSCWESKTGFSDEYLAVDLYKPKKVKYVTFVSPIWVENQSNSYKIKLQYSDDKSEWSDASELITFYIPTVATGKFDVYIPSNEEDSHRYWRLNFTEPSSTSLSAVVSGCAFMGDE